MNSLNGQLIYQVFVRNHSLTGDFQGLISDLSRIKDLGVDYLYLMPINPISELNRKGSLGSSYAIADYKGINPEYGTLNDFLDLLNKAHEIGLKVWLDIVFHHTGCDHYWVKEHPEYYYQVNGKMGNKVGDWTDIYDLNFQNSDLQNELIEVLKYWASLGVDGYRCDVASLVPIEFWLRAKKEISEIYDNFIWLAESIHPMFIDMIRNAGFIAHSDCEVYQAFDCEYDYDIYEEYLGYFSGSNSLQEFKKALARQQSTYPKNFIKSRCLENHDQPRIHFLTQENKAKTTQWLAYSFFVKGITFIYGGQECYSPIFPNQFESAKIIWHIDEQYCQNIVKFKTIKNIPEIINHHSYYVDIADDEIIKLTYGYNDKKIIGLFNVGLQVGEYKIDLPDGAYINLCSDQIITVKNGNLTLINEPIIIKEMD